MRETTLYDAFRYAGEGVLTAFRTQRNFRIHVAVGTLAVELAVILGLARWEWAILILAVGEVLTLELINTAVEAVVDLASPGYHRLAKVAKDVVAAAVLVEAATAAGVGGLIFLPRLVGLPRALYRYARTDPAALVFMVGLWVLVVVLGLRAGKHARSAAGSERRVSDPP